MTLRLAGSTSGYTEIDAPAVAGSNTLVLPTGNGSADQALVTNGSGTLSFADRGRIVQGTAQNSTSGTSIDFTGIPSWVKRVTVMFAGVSTNGTSLPTLQIGSGSVDTSGYAGYSKRISTAAVNSSAQITNGLGATTSTSAGSPYIGTAIFTLVSGNVYVAQSTFGQTSNDDMCLANTVKTLSGTLDRIRITTVNGTDTFDAGSINILYEG